MMIVCSHFFQVAHAAELWTDMMRTSLGARGWELRDVRAGCGQRILAEM